MKVIERLKELYLVKPNSGELICLQSHRGKREGDVISSSGAESRYLRVYYDDESIYLHRIIWMLCFGEIGQGLEIDHINGDSRDNRIENLRLCTHADNAKNKKRYSNNKSGVKGVYYDSTGSVYKPWRSQIRVDGKKMTLGRFESVELAREAYLKASATYHKEFARK